MVVGTQVACAKREFVTDDEVLTGVVSFCGSWQG